MGVADARLMMSCLNINPPDGRGLQRKLNQMCDRVEAINEESMVENQRYVRRVNMLRGEGDTVDLETDTSYNNRPQAGFEAATQSFSPMVEASTPRKLVVSLQTANKLCCCAHLPGYSTKFLPYGKHLDLDFADMDAIQSVICKHFREDGLRKVCKLATTNRCENLHQRVFTYAPKNTTWARNFTAMCHSAVHSSSHGTGKSMVILAEKWGLIDHAKNYYLLEHVVLVPVLHYMYL